MAMRTDPSMLAAPILIMTLSHIILKYVLCASYINEYYSCVQFFLIKYEQDVEEFLRRTATSGSSSALNPQETKSSYRENEKEERNRTSHKEHKSGSKDRERNEKDKEHHRSHHHKNRSSSREKSSRRRSKERR